MLAENANDILEKAEELSKELGRKVTVEELSEETGISEEKFGMQPESPQIILNFWNRRADAWTCRKIRILSMSCRILEIFISVPVIPMRKC